MLSPPSKKQLFGLQWQARFVICACLSVVLYFIAGSIGSGFMFFLTAMLIAAMIGGIALPWLILCNLEVSAHAPEAATAGESFTVSVALRPRGLNKLLCLLLEPQQILVGHQFKGQKARVLAYEALADVYADRKTQVKLTSGGLPRGVHELDVALNTAFPFGLVFWQRYVSTGSKTVVYPVSHAMEGFFLYRLPSLGSGTFGFPREGSCRQSTFTRSLRKYVRGDSPRNIHWPSTARAGELMVREFDAEGMPYFDIVFDLTADWSSAEQFELAVSLVASLITLGQKMGISPELKLIPALDELNLDLPSSLPGYEMQMEILARVKPVSEKRTAPPAKHTDSIIAPDERTFKQSRERTPVIVCPPGYYGYPSNSFLIEIVEKSQPGSVAPSINRLSISCVEELQAI